MDEVSHVDQFLSASHFVNCRLQIIEKRRCRCKHNPKIAQRILTNLKNLLKFTNFKTQSQSNDEVHRSHECLSSLNFDALRHIIILRNHLSVFVSYIKEYNLFRSTLFAVFMHYYLITFLCFYFYSYIIV